MSDTEQITQNFKIGVLKELHKRNLITRDELEKAIKITIE
jgi:hypothetical protein